MTQEEKIYNIIKEAGAVRQEEIHKGYNFPKSSVSRVVNKLTKKGKILKHRQGTYNILKPFDKEGWLKLNMTRDEKEIYQIIKEKKVLKQAALYKNYYPLKVRGIIRKLESLELIKTEFHGECGRGRWKVIFYCGN